MNQKEVGGQTLIETNSTGLVYRNPEPRLRDINAWHPTLVVEGDTGLICTFDLGPGPGTHDYRTYISRSRDLGDSWDDPVPLFPDELIQDPERHSVHTARPRLMSNGEMVVTIGRWYPYDPEEGIVNTANLGYAPMDLLFARSSDAGRSWDGVERVDPPLVGPGFEVAHQVVELQDGRWLWPMATWKGWDGAAPNGMKAIALVSSDRGRTWPSYLDIMDDYANGIIHWEQSVVELPDGRLLAVSWAFDEKMGTTKAINYAVSEDARTFSSPPLSTGLDGETAKLLTLPDGRILCVYRGIDSPGLCATLVSLDGDHWKHGPFSVLWQRNSANRMLGRKAVGDELSELKLGSPNLILLPTGEVMVAFWCFEEEVYNIRWVRLNRQ